MVDRLPRKHGLARCEDRSSCNRENHGLKELFTKQLVLGHVRNEEITPPRHTSISMRIKRVASSIGVAAAYIKQIRYLDLEWHPLQISL